MYVTHRCSRLHIRWRNCQSLTRPCLSTPAPCSRCRSAGHGRRWAGTEHCQTWMQGKSGKNWVGNVLYHDHCVPKHIFYRGFLLLVVWRHLFIWYWRAYLTTWNAETEKRRYYRHICFLTMSMHVHCFFLLSSPRLEPFSDLQTTDEIRSEDIMTLWTRLDQPDILCGIVLKSEIIELWKGSTLLRTFRLWSLNDKVI